MSERKFRCNTCGKHHIGTCQPYKCEYCGGVTFKYLDKSNRWDNNGL